MTSVANPSRPMESSTNGYHHHNGVASTTVSTTALNSSNSAHFKQLINPPPTSMVLSASLQLLTGPLVPPHNVYLMTQQYLQNWINWAFHQSVATPAEQERLKEVLRLAAIRLRLRCPTRDSTYADPGPINSNELSMQGHPLLLRPDATVLVVPESQAKASPNITPEEHSVPSNLRRARSLPTTGYLDAAVAGTGGEAAIEFRSCAVPEEFYEVCICIWFVRQGIFHFKRMVRPVFSLIFLCKQFWSTVDASKCPWSYLRRWLHRIVPAG